MGQKQWMPTDNGPADRTPIIVGVGQINQRVDEGAESIEPAALMANALRLAADDSGVIEYVRIQFAGFNFVSDREFNNLTLAGVGSGTTIDYVQVHGKFFDLVEDAKADEAYTLMADYLERHDARMAQALSVFG